MVKKFLLMVGLALPMSVIANPQFQERQAIEQVLKEVHFLQETVKKLKREHGHSQAKIRFNYDALLAQLQATQKGIQAFLNAKIDEIHTEAPKPVNTQLFRARSN